MRVQDVAYKVQLILEWCEKVSVIFQVPLLILLEVMCLDILICAPSS